MNIHYGMVSKEYVFWKINDTSLSHHLVKEYSFLQKFANSVERIYILNSLQSPSMHFLAERNFH